MKLPNWLTFRNKPDEERMSLDDLAAQMFTFGGNSYPINYGAIPLGSKKETIGNDFTAYCERAYKADGIVFACMNARQVVFAEARIKYQEMRNGRPGNLVDDPALSIFENPWPNGTTVELLARAIQDADLGGNHYVVAEGPRLRRLRPDWVTILLTKPPDEAVDSDVVGYLYKPGGTEDPDLWVVYPVDGSNGVVAHWAPIPDPIAQYRGMSWLTPVIREIQSDKAMTAHKENFMNNAATPNLAVSFSENISDEKFKKFIQVMEEAKTGVAHAGETIYLGAGADVTVIGSKMHEMDFKGSQGHVEERIASASGVHPLLLGLSGGFSREPLSGEALTAAKELMANMFLRPYWRSLMDSYAALVPVIDGARLTYDDRDIAFLREDQQQVATIRQLDASTLSTLILAGFTPESANDAIIHNDMSLLEHTGLFSVQLQPPMTEQPGDANTANPADGANKPGAPNNGANKPDTQGKPPPPKPAPPKKPAAPEGEGK